MSNQQAKISYTPYGAAVTLGYEAINKLRASGRTMPQGGSGDFHLWNDIDLLRRESQRFDRDNGLYRGIVNRAVDNIIGEGFTLQAQTGSKRLNRQLEAKWAEWCLDPEVRGLDDWAGVERLALRHLLVDGDIGAAKIDEDGQIQVIEAERISSGKRGTDTYLGVECDVVGRPIRYFVCDYNSTGMLDESHPVAWEAEDFVFVSCRNRFSQTRGVPAQVPNFAMFHRINDVCDSEAVAWQLLSRLAVSVTREEGASPGIGSSETDAADEDLSKRYADLGEAIFFFGKPGDKIQGIDRNIPGANFPNSITMFLRLLGMPLGLPLELVLLDWSKTNYSSARAALLQAYHMFKGWQSLLKRRWHTPIYRWKVQQWIDEGSIADNPRVFDHTWVCQPFPWVDPYKEAAAEALLNDRGYSTFTETLLSRNKDRSTFIEQRKNEIQDAIATAKEIESETGEKVPWQMFAGLDATKSVEPANVMPGGGMDPIEGPGDAEDTPEVKINEPRS